MKSVFALIGLIMELADFGIKAITSYASSDEGEKEWSDVVAKLTDLGVYSPDGEGDEPAPLSVSESNTFTLEDIQRLASKFDEGSGEYSGLDDREASMVSRVTRHPKKAVKNDE